MTERSDTIDLPQLRGRVFLRDHGGHPQAYERVAFQYATSSEPAGTMRPSLIVEAADEADVIAVVNFARDHRRAVALRSGGHHYIGASSTCGDNIQLDTRFLDHMRYDEASHRVHVGPGVCVQRLSAWLARKGLFVPHGQCPKVALGGHVQSGGWGTVRALGLMHDHVESFDIITADGLKRSPSATSQSRLERELFWAVLGGSPGSFGVITSVVLRPLRAADHPHTRGFKKIYVYSEGLVRRLARVMEALSDRGDEIPPDYDFGIAVVGPNPKSQPGLDQAMKGKHGWHPALVVVVATWMNLGGPTQPYDPDNEWFALIRRAIGRSVPLQVLLDDETPTPAGVLFERLVSTRDRAFQLPYRGTDFALCSTRLGQHGFADWFADRIASITPSLAQSALAAATSGRVGEPELSHLRVQAFWVPSGGRHSALAQNPNNTAFSWRNCQSWCSMVAFYDGDTGRANSEAWTKQNADHVSETFGDRRFLWAPHLEPGETLDERAHEFFGPAPDTHARLLALKREVDPEGVFSAHAFGVGFEADPAHQSTTQGAPISVPTTR